MFQKMTMLPAAVASIALPFSAQSEDAEHDEVAVRGSGSVVTSTTYNGTEIQATGSIGVLAAGRIIFSKHHGAEAKYGYARDTEKYTSSAGSPGVKKSFHEISGASAFRMQLRQVTPFALAAESSAPSQMANHSRRIECSRQFGRI